MPSISSSTFRRVLAVAGVAMAIILGGCSTSNNASGTTTTTAGSGGSGSGSGSGSDTQQLSSLSASVKAAESATFKAVYTANENGTTSTVTIEQAPPKSFFSSGNGSVINTGTTTYFCSNSNGSNTCISESSTTNPLGSLAALFSPATAVTALQSYESAVAAKIAGVNASFSSASFAGQDATCVTVSRSGQSAKYCVTKSGILAYEGSGANSFQLTSYSSSPPSSDFGIPAGATVESIPSGSTY